MNISDAFNQGAQDYDKYRRFLIPCFDEFYGTVIRILPFQPTDPIHVMDLGAGTGLLAWFILQNFPRAELYLVDIAQKMLEEAKKRFQGTSASVRYLDLDYTTQELAELPNTLDVVASSLSIHHSSAEEKQTLFRKIFRALKPGGIFINADMSLGETPEIETRLQKDWLDQVKKTPIPDSELTAAMARTRFDKKDTLADQLDWLTHAGFTAVHCWYANFGFTVYAGEKPKQWLIK